MEYKINIKKEKSSIIATFNFDREIINKVKLAGMRWDPVKKHWHMPDNQQNRELLDKVLNPGPAIINSYNDYQPSSYLMSHQKTGVELAKTAQRHLYVYDTGTGKTALAIDIIRMTKLKALVVCPLTVIQNAWFEDLAKFGTDFKAVDLWQLWHQQKKYTEAAYLNKVRDAHICIVNFEGFKSQRDLLKKAGFGIVIVDESSKIKNNKSQITKELTAFCEDMRNVYLLSGTPAPNSLLEYFPQIRIVDPTLFGKSFYKFRCEYFFEKGFKWIPFPNREKELLEKIARVSSTVRKEDVLDLPERTFNVRSVSLDSSEIKAYQEMLKKLIIELDDVTITAANAAVKIMKLRQITAGFLIDEDTNTHVFGKSKLSALQDLLEEIGKHQVIIWTQFQYEARQIKKTLGDKAEIINGTIAKAERDANFQKFKSGNLPYLIAHPRSLGHGVTLTNCSYAIYYSIDYSYESYYQSCDRIYRYGQRNACTYYHLIVPGSIDEVIYKALKTKGNMEKAVLDYIKKGGKDFF